MKYKEETKPSPKFTVGDIVYSRTWQRSVVILKVLPDNFYAVSDGIGWFKTHEDNLCRNENGNVNNAQKIVLEKKKPKFPTKFTECCEILYPNDNFQVVSQRVKGHKGDLLFHFQKLLICRDAYWKIAGEEMGLGKPWEPDTCQIVYSIRHDSNRISFCNDMFGGYFILEFPTAEMRDAFYENFKELIEICKELL